MWIADLVTQGIAATGAAFLFHASGGQRNSKPGHEYIMIPHHRVTPGLHPHSTTRHPQDGVTTLVWEGQSQTIDILELEPGCYSILLDGRSVEVRLDKASY